MSRPPGASDYAPTRLVDVSMIVCGGCGETYEVIRWGHKPERQFCSNQCRAIAKCRATQRAHAEARQEMVIEGR
jgi:hypothetical protein